MACITDHYAAAALAIVGSVGWVVIAPSHHGSRHGLRRHDGLLRYGRVKVEVRAV